MKRRADTAGEISNHGREQTSTNERPAIVVDALMNAAPPAALYPCGGMNGTLENEECRGIEHLL